MFCGNCGSEIQTGDAFCGICGTPSEQSQPAAPKPGQPAKADSAPRPKAAASAPPPPPSPKPHAASAQATAPEPSQGKTKLKKKTPAPAEKPAKPPKEKKSGGKTLLLLVILFIAAGGAAAYYFLVGPGMAPKAPPIIPPPPEAAVKPAMDVKGFAARLCEIAKTNPMTIDSELYDFTFHARMSAGRETLESSGYSMDEYVDFAVEDLKKQMSGRKYEKCIDCQVAEARTMNCRAMYAELASTLEIEGVSYDPAAVSSAGAAAGLESCGTIVLHQTWSEASGPNPIVYFVGKASGEPKVLHYFYSEHAE